MRRPKAPPVVTDGGQKPPDGRHARRQKTQERLLAAVGTILLAEGVAGLGVNAISAEARVEKTLIYRYYGDVEGLMQAYASTSDFWPSLAEILEGALELADPARAAARMLTNYSRALRRRPVTIDLLAWECTQRNPLTIAIEVARQARNEELFGQLEKAGFSLETGLPELSMLFSAAIHYLAIRGRSLSSFGPLPLEGEAAWAAMEALFEASFRGMLARQPAEVGRRQRPSKPT